MSSSYDSGKTREAAAKAKQSKCPKAEDGKHRWKRYGVLPSVWDECTKCGDAIFWK